MDGQETVKTFEYPNMTVRVHIPDLSKEERARRMKAIYQAAAELLKSQTKE